MFYANIPLSHWNKFMSEMKEGYKNIDNLGRSCKDKAWAWGVYKRQRENLLELSKVLRKYANKYMDVIKFFKKFERFEKKTLRWRLQSVIISSNDMGKIMDYNHQIELYTIYLERAERCFNNNRFKQGIRELQRIDGQISKPTNKRKLLFGNYKFTSALSESPLEDKFWVYAKDRISGLRQQYHIGRYRADFAIPEKKIVIECDGQYYHNPINDMIRDEILKSDGWETIRFNGNQINYNIRSCIDYVLKKLKKKEIKN